MRLHAERGERRLAALRAEVEHEERRYNGAGEAQVMLGRQLAKIMQIWRVEWEAARDYHIESRKVMGPLDWLKEMTGIHIRRIHGLMNAEFDFVGESQAELLLIVMNMEHLLKDGTVMFIPNPNWSTEKWIAYMEEQGCI